VSNGDDILADFHADLRRVEELLALVEAFRDFGRSTPDPDAAWPEARRVHAGASGVRTDLPLLSGSLLLYVCGRFEYFVRQLVTDVADDLAGRAGCYADLPEQVRTALRARTLEIAAQPARYGYDEAGVNRLIASLAANLRPPRAGGGGAGAAGGGGAGPGGSGDAGVAIPSSILALTSSNMRPEVLQDVFRRVDVGNLWSEIGKQAPLKAALALRDDRACTAEARRRLAALMDERNSVAHPTATTTFPDPDRVLRAIGFLRILSRIVVDVVTIPAVPAV